MGFEKYDDAGSGRGRPAGSDPMVSLRKSGSIGVNQAGVDEYFDDNEGAVLYFDEEANRIGIEPVADKDADEGAYTLSTMQSGATIAGQSFMETYGLVPDVTTQYEPSWDEDEGLVVVDLDQEGSAYGESAE